MKYEEQKILVPGLDDGHSGNTFGMSVYLAYWYLTKKDNVTKIQGALSPIVGSKEYEEKNKRISISDKI